MAKTGKGRPARFTVIVPYLTSYIGACGVPAPRMSAKRMASGKTPEEALKYAKELAAESGEIVSVYDTKSIDPATCTYREVAQVAPPKSKKGKR